MKSDRMRAGQKVYSCEIHDSKKQKVRRKSRPMISDREVEADLRVMADYYEAKRLERLSRPVGKEKDTKPKSGRSKPNVTDMYFHRFVKELEKDEKLRKQIKVASANRVQKDFNKFCNEPNVTDKPFYTPTVCSCVCNHRNNSFTRTRKGHSYKPRIGGH
ncbi:uncharacterized protein LOC103524271 isoform X1 [Diaphorina citri]|uniref:Uncharacterized protein LOC103524271 isoform X1 n=1 Tax=Diaphorina citri TaxID=121845 RepID=A0A1S3DU45_DIACI|nr:uncharacterized protein LOC103524271 isoform X1 [Diaphorina citri]